MKMKFLAKGTDYVILMHAKEKAIDPVTRTLLPVWWKEIRFQFGTGVYETSDPEEQTFLLTNPAYGKDFTLVSEPGKEAETQRMEQELKKRASGTVSATLTCECGKSFADPKQYDEHRRKEHAGLVTSKPEEVPVV